ncbi:MAG: PAS domain S-box protein [Spirochaetes bacterium]|nr:PAS domain S-box protein [Spirochaetota bacterium]
MKVKAKTSLFHENPEPDTEQYLHAVLNTITDCIFLIDKYGKINWANSSAKKSFSKDSDSLNGENLYDILPASAKKEFKNNIKEIIKTGNPVQFEHTEDNLITGYKLQFIPENKGEPDLIAVYCRDITENKQKEISLQREVKRYRSIVDNTNDAFLIHDFNENILDLNENACRLLGYTKEELLGSSLKIIDSEDNKNQLNERLKHLQKNDSIVFESIHIRKDGTLIQTEVSSRIVSREGSGIVLGFIRDISERKKVEVALKESEKKYRTLYNTMTQGVVYLNMSGEFISINPAAERILGISLEQIKGIFINDPRWKTIQEDGSRISEDDHPLLKAIKTGKEVKNLVHGIFNPEKGTYTWIKINAVPLFRSGEKEPYQWYAIIEDITVQRKSEENYRMLFREMQDGFALHEIIRDDKGDPVDFRIIDINPAFEKMTKILAKNTKGMNLFRNIPGIDRNLVNNYIHVASTGEARSFEHYFPKNNKHFKVTSFQPAPDQLASIFTDITDRIQTEKSLRINEAKFRAIVENIHDGISFTDAHGIVQYRSPSFLSINGYTSEDRIGHKGFDTVHPDDLKTVHSLWKELIDNPEKIITAVFRARHKDRSWKYIEATAQNLLGNPDIKAILQVARDVTERVQAEARLKQNLHETQIRYEFSKALTIAETEEDVLDALIKHSGFFDDAFVTICIFDDSGDERDVILQRQNAFKSGIKQNLQEGIRLPLSTFKTINYFEPNQPFVSNNIYKDERQDPDSIKIHKRSGIVSQASFPLIAGNEWIGFIAIFSKIQDYFDNDKLRLYQTIAEQGSGALHAARLREKIRVSQQRLLLLVQQSPLAVIEWDNNFRIVSWNPAAEKIFGYSEKEALRLHTDGLISEEHKNIMENHFHNLCKMKTSYSIELVNTGKDGKTVICEWFNSPLIDSGGNIIGIASIVQDITEHKHAEKEKERLESQLRQAQKMEALGNFVGGIAHDFNNILSVLVGFTNLLDMEIEPDSHLKTYIEQILSSSEKAVNLTKSLLAFGRKQPVVQKPLNLNSTISEIEKILKRLITEDITLTIQLNKNDIIINGDQAQIDQILFNLATNARDAMPEGGTISIATSITEIDDTCEEKIGYGKPGKYALIEFSDTGTGMDEDTIEQIFDPFFTTKEIGKGTGLGMATVYGIVKKHGGHITISSKKGSGSSFYIYFPLSDNILNYSGIEPAEIEFGNETILLAEDFESVRKITKTMLTKYGYHVIEAVDGEDAINKFNKYKNIDLAILDSVMPKKNGREAYEEIKKINPEIKVLFCSGYTHDIILSKGIEEKKFDFISKPLSMRDLLSKVREILDRR